MVAEFVGAQPPTPVDQFLDSLLPSEADALVEAGGEEAPSPARSSSSRRVWTPGLALARDPARARAIATARSQSSRKFPGSFAAEGLAARLRLEDDEGAARRVRRAGRR